MIKHAVVTVCPDFLFHFVTLIKAEYENVKNAKRNWTEKTFCIIQRIKHWILTKTITDYKHAALQSNRIQFLHP